MPSRYPHYQTLLGFITSLQYPDFSTVTAAGISFILQEADGDFVVGSYLLDVFPYTWPGINLLRSLHKTRVRQSISHAVRRKPCVQRLQTRY